MHADRVEPRPAVEPQREICIVAVPVILDRPRDRRVANEPALDEWNRRRVAIGRHVEPRRLAGLEPRGKAAAGAVRDDGAVVDLHVGGATVAGPHRELGAEIEHLGGGRVEAETRHALGHLHDRRPFGEEGPALVDKIERAGAL